MHTPSFASHAGYVIMPCSCVMKNRLDSVRPLRNSGFNLWIAVKKYTTLACQRTRSRFQYTRLPFRSRAPRSTGTRLTSNISIAISSR